ncbi:hypothetical protein DLAC_03956 [Tieghemostelium lacteum]|uniref:Ion transport domain-containing protein n=1 Tax=Tieghemostelium lacteum TaxID=361077 RepID=A0A151ZRW7_TIELA|nr:hypothetical protein DLAC_03956 [Tieghemostelium lacteum]|eukprot:KYQ96670.1 hypothetical protein DLAC_03956 [Tieghemostelium lacteum]
MNNKISFNDDDSFDINRGLGASNEIPKINNGERSIGSGGKLSFIEDDDNLHGLGGGGSGNNINSNVGLYIKDSRQCSSLADRVLFSNRYYYSYLVMISLNFILIIWLIVNLIKRNTSIPNHWLFITLDVLVNVTLAVEIILQMISLKKKYFYELSNIFDLFVLILSIAGLLMYFHSSSSGAHYDLEGIVIIFLTSIRYIVQCLRLLSLIKRQKMKSSTFNSRIDFTELKESDLDFDIDSSDF